VDLVVSAAAVEAVRRVVADRIEADARAPDEVVASAAVDDVRAGAALIPTGILSL
jgi:hypothetical protein